MRPEPPRPVRDRRGRELLALLSATNSVPRQYRLTSLPAEPSAHKLKVPDDGPAGQLLKMMDRHPFRPAHIHLVVRHKGHSSLTTQIFDKGCKYLADDSVFAVKDELAVTFAPRDDDPQAKLGLEYNITLAPSS